MSLIVHQCGCRKSYRVDESLAGRSVRCKGCGATSKVELDPVVAIDGEAEDFPAIRLDTTPAPVAPPRPTPAKPSSRLSMAWVNAPLLACALVNFAAGYERYQDYRWGGHEKGATMMGVGAAAFALSIARGRVIHPSEASFFRFATALIAAASIPNPIAAGFAVVAFFAASLLLGRCMEAAR